MIKKKQKIWLVGYAEIPVGVCIPECIKPDRSKVTPGRVLLDAKCVFRARSPNWWLKLGIEYMVRSNRRPNGKFTERNNCSKRTFSGRCMLPKTGQRYKWRNFRNSLNRSGEFCSTWGSRSVFSFSRSVSHFCVEAPVGCNWLWTFSSSRKKGFFSFSTTREKQGQTTHSNPVAVWKTSAN